MPPVKRFDQAVETIAEQHVRRKPFMVGAANDERERRADRVADLGLHVLRAGGSTLPAAASTPTTATSRVQRSAMSRSDAGGQLDAASSSTLDRAIGQGRQFEPAVQQRIQRATGHDASTARVHTDARADRLARSMQAEAFTVDNNVFFARGAYRPDTDAGMHTVLHESAHLAEGGSRVQRQTIRRKLSFTTADLDGSFKHETGARGLTKKLSSDEIPKMREALKKYHAGDGGAHQLAALKQYKADMEAAAQGNPLKANPSRKAALAKLQAATASNPQQTAALQNLLELADQWLRKHPKPRDAQERMRTELIDSIRTEAGMEYGRIRSQAAYVGDAGISRQARLTPGAVLGSGPGANPLKKLDHDAAFIDGTLYENRNNTSDTASSGGSALEKRDELVATGELNAMAPEVDAALRAGIESLSPAEFGAIRTYTGADYQYMNPNVGGWGKGPMNAPTEMKIGDRTAKFDGNTDATTAKSNREMYEEAGLHAGLIGQAFEKLPVWKGTSYKGMTFDADYLGVTSASAYKASDFWSTSEARSIAQRFVGLSAGGAKRSGKKVTKAAICTISVVNGRDIARLSDSSTELEILLPAGSIYAIGARKCLVRGKDDAEIRSKFGEQFFKDNPEVTEFWLIDMKQRFSGEKDTVGAYSHNRLFKGAKTPANAQKDINPWEKMGGRRMLFN